MNQFPPPHNPRTKARKLLPPALKSAPFRAGGIGESLIPFIITSEYSFHTVRSRPFVSNMGMNDRCPRSSVQIPKWELWELSNLSPQSQSWETLGKSGSDATGPRGRASSFMRNQLQLSG